MSSAREYCSKFWQWSALQGSMRLGFVQATTLKFRKQWTMWKITFLQALGMWTLWVLFSFEIITQRSLINHWLLVLQCAIVIWVGFETLAWKILPEGKLCKVWKRVSGYVAAGNRNCLTLCHRASWDQVWPCDVTCHTLE